VSIVNGPERRAGDSRAVITIESNRGRPILSYWATTVALATRRNEFTAALVISLKFQ
jgi:hypothetical protein